MDLTNVTTLPAYGNLEQSGLSHLPTWGKGKPGMAEAIDRYKRCAEMRAALRAWRAESLLGGSCRACYEDYLEYGGDPHWEDDRPFRGTDELKVWGDGLKAQLVESGNVLQAWTDAGVKALHEALEAMGRELGAKYKASDLPLYGRIKQAYAEGDVIRQERLDGLQLPLQPAWDAVDKAPFRDALLTGLGVNRNEFSECISRINAAFESLILIAAGKRHMATLTAVDAHQVLREQGYRNAAEWEPLLAEMRPVVFAAHWLDQDGQWPVKP